MLQVMLARHPIPMSLLEEMISVWSLVCKIMGDEGLGLVLCNVEFESVFGIGASFSDGTFQGMSLCH